MSLEFWLLLGIGCHNMLSGAYSGNKKFPRGNSVFSQSSLLNFETFYVSRNLVIIQMAHQILGTMRLPKVMWT